MNRDFALLLAMVACFGFSWSFYLILPKFLATELSMNAQQIGAVVAVPGLASVAATPIVGKLIDRYGRRIWITLGTVLMMITGIGFVFVRSDGPLLYVMQVFCGLAFVVTFNAAGTLTADFAPAPRLAQAIGLFGAANLSMNAVSPAVGEIIADHSGWQTVFTVSAVAGLVATALSLLLKDPPRAPHDASATPRSVLGGPLMRVYVATFLYTAAFAALFTLSQPFALEQGVTQLRDFFIAFTIVAVAVRIGGGTVIDRVGSYRASVASLALYATVPLILWQLGPTRLGAVGAAMGLAHGVLYPALSALAIERSDEKTKGMAFAIVHGAFNGGHALFSFTLGALATHYGFGWTFVSAALITALGLGVLTFARSSKKTFAGNVVDL